MTRVALLAVLCAACAGPDVPAPARPIAIAPPPAEQQPPPADAALVSTVDESPPPPAVDDTPWLRGSTHVHAKPSGDSSEPITDVLHWYEQRGYDFIALTDHNRVTEIDGSTLGKPYVHTAGLIVLAGIELTHNPTGCEPAGDPSRKCRIHVNVLGVTERPTGKQEWAERHSHLRVDMYAAAIREAQRLHGALVQINHPQWYWGMTPDVLTEIAKGGAQLVEIENIQFDTWNRGDAAHPSMEALWDAALVRGARIWGVASDDAHDYEDHGGKWPAGGAWVMVHAKKDPQAILDALAAGRFYATNGVTLVRAGREGDELVIELAPSEHGNYTIGFVENGALVETVTGRSARRALPRTGYLRAVVTRDDGKKAWVQPVTSP